MTSLMALENIGEPENIWGRRINVASTVIVFVTLDVSGYNRFCVVMWDLPFIEMEQCSEV